MLWESVCVYTVTPWTHASSQRGQKASPHKFIYSVLKGKTCFNLRIKSDFIYKIRQVVFMVKDEMEVNVCVYSYYCHMRGLEPDHSPSYGDKTEVTVRRGWFLSVRLEF